MLEKLACAWLLTVFFVWLRRIFWVRRFRKDHPPLEPRNADPSPASKVSIIVPAKDEEKNILNCLEHLSAQAYSNFELIAVDDRSKDATPRLLEEFARRAKVPFKTVRIEKLPPGWTGKNYAMFTGSRAASGEWLLFTDADTTHRPSSVRTAMACAIEKKIDLLTLAPETESRTFWENTVQPLAVGSLALWFQTHRVNDPANKNALANGQFILIRREVYEKLGGNESVRSEVIEDVALARRARAAGYVVQFLNGTLLYATRMYSSLGAIRTGWTRIYTFLFDKKLQPIIDKIFRFIFFSLFSFVALSVELIFWLLKPELFSMRLFGLSLGVSLWIVLIRFIANKELKANPWYAFLHPVGSIVMIDILVRCAGRIVFNRSSVWRGDRY